MLEYRIVEKVKEGREFSLHSFNDFNSCYNKLLFIISDKKNYYVHNDFFKNIYDPYFSIYHYKIEFREVSDYKTY